MLFIPFDDERNWYHKASTYLLVKAEGEAPYQMSGRSKGSEVTQQPGTAYLSCL